LKIKLNSIFVDDQQKALDFYTDILGFKKSQDIPVGEFRWIQLASPEGGDAELSLEPNANPAAKTYQEALFEQGIPITAFEVDDLDAEFRRLSDLGVAFTTEPTNAGNVSLAVFVDTCGNLIQIYQHERE
jgi:catechol 2,3-dioxygenase-like lactoylglutathione lyase family enzyme